MDPERHKQITDLFIKVCDLPEEERSAFLDSSCKDDTALREAVEALLAHDAGVHSEFAREEAAASDDAPTSAARRARRAAAHELVDAPKRIGPYRILEPLGAGGMGAVFLAEQVEPVRRRVALKIIRTGLGSREVVVRFESERQALALMDHPNIAQVFDAGATEDGRPYFVMEYVPGVPITDHCDRHRLTLRERLGLFLQVCEAVQHAHQKGVIHRDIKPTNVLVMFRDNEAVVKVIDFGVAKATERSLVERTLFTEMGQLIGTPEYMSPEQAEMTSQDIDTRADVYSLGVLLYEIVTGTLPFESGALRKAGFAEIQRIICEVDPPKPSTRLSAAGKSGVKPDSDVKKTDTGAIARQVRGDLDWITMRALEKDRTRRYTTVAAMAEDIRRHLRNEPVTAGPPSAVYRARKFVRRHRAGVVATTVTGFIVVSAAVVSTAAAIDASRTRSFAQARDAAGRMLSQSLLGEVHEAITNLQGATEARTLLIEASSRYLKSLEEQADNDPSLLGEIANGYERLARIESADLGGSLGETGAALESAASAVALRRRAVAQSPTEPAATRALASALALQGALLQRAQDAPSAQRAYDESLGLRRSLVAANTADDALRGQLASSLLRVGDIAKREGRYDKARALFEESLAHREQVAASQGVSEDKEIATALIRLGNLAIDMGEPENAQRRYTRALAIRRDIAVAKPDDTRAQRNLLWALYFAADPAIMLNDADAAVESLTEAQAIAQRRFDADPKNARARTDLLLVEERLGDVQMHVASDSAAAVKVYERIVRLAARAASEDAADDQNAENLAQALERLADAQRQTDDVQAAIVTGRRALAVVTPIVQRDPTNRNRRFVQATIRAGLGQALLDTERAKEAIDQLRAAVADFDAIDAVNSPDTFWRYGFAQALQTLAKAAQRLGDAKEAQQSAARALALLPAAGEDADADALRASIETLLATGDGAS